MYTCTATSDSGESSQSATLSIGKSSNSGNIFIEHDPILDLPVSPVDLQVMNATESSLSLMWKPIPKGKSGASSLLGYTIEYFSPDLRTGWVTVARRITSSSFTVIIKYSYS